MRLFWTNVVYRIWGERNNRKHGGNAEAADQVLRRISLDLRYRSMSFNKYADNDVNRQICGNWELPCSILNSVHK